MPFLNLLLKLISRVSFADTTIEFAQPQELKTDWNLILTETPITDNRSCGPQVVTQITTNQAGDYLTINLETGKKWLTSNLYFVAQTLNRMQSPKYFVFVDHTEDLRNRFVGIAYASKVRWALAKEYPWMEIAFTYLHYDNTYKVTSRDGALDYGYSILNLYIYFKSMIRYNGKSTDNNEIEIFKKIHGKDSPYYDKGEWILRERLFDWSNVPGRDSKKLINYLKGIIQLYYLAEDVKIKKDDSKRSIIIDCEKSRSVEIKIEESNKEATLTYYLNNKPENICNKQPYILPVEEKERNNEFTMYKYYERAKWLKADDIEKLLGEDLYKTYYIDSPEISEEQKVKFIISKKEPLVAVTNEMGEFLQVIDRSRLIEKVARNLTL